MVKPPAAGSARAQGRQGVATDAKVVSFSDWEAEMEELDGSSEFKKIMFYGDSGCGKTVLAGSAPDSLILACEPGYISAARTSLGSPVGKRTVRKIPDTPTLLAGLDWLEAGNARNYKWIVLEGATTLETKARLGYAAEAFDANPASRAHRNLPDKPDYFNTQNFIRSAIARFIDLPVNLIVTAHAMRLDDDAGDRLVVPAFQQRDGALSNYVSGLMHCVGFMRKRWVGKGEERKEVRRILWQQYADPETGTIYFAKDQFAALGRTMDDANMARIVARIDGEEPARPTRSARRA